MADSPKSPTVRPRLGRGLSALISSTEPQPGVSAYEPMPSVGEPGKAAARLDAPVEGDGTKHVPIDRIAPNPFQPRRDFDPEELLELTQSIRQQGILQPLVVAPASDGEAVPYVLVAGERRLRAAKEAGLLAVPCVVRPATRQQMLEWALVENIQRADLNPVERATAYRDYMDRFGLTQAAAAERLGEPRTTIANYLRMLDLCDEVQRMLLDGALSFGHAKVLAGLASLPGRQLALARRVVEAELSVRHLEELLAVDATGEAAPASAPAGPRVKAAHLRDLEERLAGSLGTRVTILPGRSRHTGRIVLEYYSLDDFDRIASRLGLSDGE